MKNISQVLVSWMAWEHELKALRRPFPQFFFSPTAQSFSNSFAAAPPHFKDRAINLELADLVRGLLVYFFCRGTNDVCGWENNRRLMQQPLGHNCNDSKGKG